MDQVNEKTGTVETRWHIVAWSYWQRTYRLVKFMLASIESQRLNEAIFMHVSGEQAELNSTGEPEQL